MSQDDNVQQLSSHVAALQTTTYDTNTYNTA